MRPPVERRACHHFFPFIALYKAYSLKPFCFALPFLFTLCDDPETKEFTYAHGIPLGREPFLPITR
jgi:hypothetical protein